MLAIIGKLLSLFGPAIVWGIKIFVKNKEAKEKAVKNYYEFIAQIDKKSATKVANYIGAERELANVQRQIRERELIEPERESAHDEIRRYTIPTIVDVPVKVSTHGKYLTKNGNAKGLVIHYTAGRFDKGHEDAKSTLSYLAKRGLGCLVMDTEGIIYKSSNQALDEISWHAGKSNWKGTEGVSRYCFGMEICNAGRLNKENGEFKTWFEQSIDAKDVRIIEADTENQKSGVYHAFTEKQEKSLINFIFWQADTNPDFFIGWVMGHDECSPERKQDPGGSLSMTMPSFRATLENEIGKQWKSKYEEE